MTIETPGTEEGIRGRFRARVRDEVKAAALRQLASGGPQAVSVNAIAKELGVSGPALYRYFAGRNELLEALVLDAYTDLAATLTAAASAPPPRRGRTATSRTDSPGARLHSVARAYRGWAVAQPHRYRLLFAPPVAGLDAHSPVLVDAASSSMRIVLRLLADVVPDAPAPESRALTDQLEELVDIRGDTATPGVAWCAIRLWATVHGLVGLELGGNTQSMGLDAELLLDSEIITVLNGLGRLDSNPGQTPDTAPPRAGRVRIR